jgi:hypothetical protein
VGGDRSVDAGTFKKRGETGARSAGDLVETAGDECSVGAAEWHDIADGADRDEIDVSVKIDCLSQVIGERSQGDEGDAAAGEVPKRIGGAVQVWIDDGNGIGQRILGGVMVNDDHIELPLVGIGNLFAGAGAGIDGDDESSATLDQGGEG